MWTERRSKIAHIMQVTGCHRFGRSLDAHSTYEDGRWADKHGGTAPKIVLVRLGLASPASVATVLRRREGLRWLAASSSAAGRRRQATRSAGLYRRAICSSRRHMRTVPGRSAGSDEDFRRLLADQRGSSFRGRLYERLRKTGRVAGNRPPPPSSRSTRISRFTRLIRRPTRGTSGLCLRAIGCLRQADDPPRFPGARQPRLRYVRQVVG